jgi:hypothetical protein
MEKCSVFIYVHEVIMKRLFVSILSVSMFFISCATPPKAVNSEKYGQDAPPVWMPLTQIEFDTLKMAISGLDEETKFKLALFFTGNTREKGEVEALFDDYKKFVTHCDKELSSITDLHEKGKKLHELFFKEYIHTQRAEGYQSSGIAGLILKKEYDINSAAMLFSIISERYGFAPQLILTKGDQSVIVSKRTNLSMKVISGQIYLTLHHPELSNPVNVFVTWHNGYDLQLDMDFFKQLQKNNPETVKNAQIEHKRYTEGRKVSLNEALLLQYKIDKAYEVVDLDFAPGIRRSEMAALLTDSCEVLIDRIWAWRDIYSILFSVWKNGEILPFIELIQPELERTRINCDKDAEFKKVAGSFYLFSAAEYARSVNGLKMKESIQNGYKYIDTTSENYNADKSWLINSVHQYLGNVIKTGTIDSQVGYINEIIELIPEHNTKIEVAASFYYHAGTYYFNKSDFWKSAQFYNSCNKLGENEYKKICEDNGAVSYLNYAVSALNNGKCSKAKNGKNECFNKFPDSESCKKTQKLVEDNCK